MRSVKSLLPKTLRKFKLDKGIKQSQIINSWQKIVGKTIAQHSKATVFRYKVLFIDVDNSIWMNELQFMKNTIIDKINSEFGEKIVQAIRFRFCEKI